MFDEIQVWLVSRNVHYSTIRARVVMVLGNRSTAAFHDVPESLFRLFVEAFRARAVTLHVWRDYDPGYLVGVTVVKDAPLLEAGRQLAKV